MLCIQDFKFGFLYSFYAINNLQLFLSRAEENSKRHTYQDMMEYSEGTPQHLFYHVVFAHVLHVAENGIIQISGTDPLFVLFQAI